MALESSLFARPTTATVEVKTSSTVAITPPLQLKNSGRLASESPKQTNALAVVEVNRGTPTGSNFSNFLLEENLVNTNNLNLSGTRVVYNIENINVARVPINNSVTTVYRKLVPVYQDNITYGLQNSLLPSRITNNVSRAVASESVTPSVIPVIVSRNQTVIIPRVLSTTVVTTNKITDSTLTGGTGGTGGGGTGGGGTGGGTGATAFWS